MKTALIAITKHGVEHARELKSKLPGSEFWVSEKQKALAPDADGNFATIKEFTEGAWEKYDGLIYHVSLGAVVRTIAPFLKGKDVDPAVVTVDDGKRFAISVLSGHVGGANELTEQVAAILGAAPVVTTASDARATIPVDILGRELGWTLEDKANVTPVSAAVVNEKPVAFVQECGPTNWWTRPTPLPASIKVFKSLAEARAAGSFDAYLVVSDRAKAVLDAELGAEAAKAVIYRPKTLWCGMGCDFGTDLDELQGLIEATFAEAGLSPKCIAGLASIDIKEKEEALHQLAGHLGVGIKFFSRDELNEKKTKSMPNPLVMKYTGAVGVSEPSAMLAAGVGDLVVLKHKSKRATLAVARQEFV
jgi:cobalt-precorrin 5A hydrolase